MCAQEINRRNRRIIKQTFNSDVLEINDDVLPQKTTKKEEQRPKVTATPKQEADTETDDWESMFDDHGECLDPKVMDEITAAVGKVSIVKPKSNYKVKFG